MKHSYPMFGKDFRRRWLYTPSGLVLHRIAEIEYTYEDIVGNGIAACGLRAEFRLPGFLSRLGRPRCKRCCKKAGVPEGDGQPFNSGIFEPNDPLEMPQ